MVRSNVSQFRAKIDLYYCIIYLSSMKLEVTQRLAEEFSNSHYRSADFFGYDLSHRS